MEKPKYYNKHIEEQNKKYPMMEYFLESKPLKDCSRECQEQIQALKDHEYELRQGLCS